MAEKRWLLSVSSDRTGWAWVALPALWILWLAGPVWSQSADRVQLAEQFDQTVPGLLRSHCGDCHSGEEAEAGMRFDVPIRFDAVHAEHGKWQKVVKMLASGAMPPDDQAQLEAGQRRQLVQLLRAALDELDCSQGQDPGRVTVRRLNRNEYDNTIRDLFGIDLKLAREFPSDDVGHGFDNIGDVLAISPLLFEKYLAAAEKIAETVVQDPETLRVHFRREGRELRPAGELSLNDDGLWGLFSSSGHVAARFEVPRDGRYHVRVVATADQAGPEPARMELLVDGKPAGTIDVTIRAPRTDTFEQVVELGKGSRQIAVRFVNDYYRPEEPDPQQRDRNLYVGAVSLHGPLDLRDKDFTELHRRFVMARPADSTSRRDVRRAARQVLDRFLVRAFRRPVSEDELRSYIDLVDLAVQNGDSYEMGLRVAVAAALVSPHFLFRIEADPDNLAAGTIRTLNDYELASRLSYFLWSSMPDEELFQLAAANKLHEPQVLEQQVRRMLKDPKSWALAENFAAQWLNLRNLNEAQPDPQQFPGFDDALRQAMLRETLELFMHVVQNDRPITELLTADYSFLNRRLAQWYGVPADKLDDEHFQQVSLVDTPRRGVLTHGSILTLTSNPRRTSPVKRGKWIMENILGTPPPEPPANVPLLEETEKISPELSLRQQLEIHRKDPNCAACHRQMDTLGFGFENFDAVGRWRTLDKGKPIDVSGILPDGGKFDGVGQLIELLASQKRDFARVLTEKMLTFALGRGLEYADTCTVKEVVRRLEENEYRFSELVLGIVQSEPFRKRRVEHP
ncbi:MAG: filamin [Pirellulaceae bacterium]|nr:MAG: filamin [Pirellulaceae bacterium]